MSHYSHDGHRSPSSRGGGLLRHPPAYSSSHLRTPPSPSAAPSAASVSAALWAFRNASASPSVVGSEAPTPQSIPHVAGTTPYRVTTSPPQTGTTVSTSEDILRGIYNEKLHASVRSIITTLSNELPADHIFLQLLADPSTQQYCKVRLAEVVEGFLYSTQAEQYHELATELARREQEGEMQRQRIEELEAALAQAVREATLPPHHTRSSAGDGVGEDAEHDGSQTGPTSRSPSTSIQVPSAAGGASAPPKSPPNPMDDEEARRELLRVLEQTTHDQELHRCRQALQAVTKVVAVTADEANYADKYVYEEAVMGELYACVASLLQYVDGALESQERLRREIDEQHPWVFGNNSGEGDAGVPDARVTSDYATPHRPRLILGEDGGSGTHGAGSPYNSAVSSRLSSAGAAGGLERGQRPPTHSAGSQHQHQQQQQLRGVGAIQQRRAELQRLTHQLRNGQLTSRQVLEQLAQSEVHHRRDVSQLQRAVEALRGDAAIAATTAEAARNAKEAAERQRAEGVAAAAAERTELRDALADARAELAAATYDLQAARREAQRLSDRLDAAAKKDSDVLEELSAAKAALAQKEEQLREQQKERGACQAELTALKAAHHADVDALQDAARELLCLRVEKTMASLSAAYQELKATKADLLEREGYRPVCLQYGATAAEHREAARHATARLQAAESAQREKSAVVQSSVDALGVLLRSIWADGATETALEPTGGSSSTTGETEAAGEEYRAAGRERETTSSSSRSASYSLPTTLAGVCAALEYAYADTRARHHARQKTIESLRTTLIGKDVELRAAQANDAQLRDLLRAERAKSEQWALEMAQLGEQNPMRDLLARQDALLRAVSDERNALRRQWSSLSGDYIALEQRNGVLHARCAAKEHENARLSGMLLRSATSSSATTSIKHESPAVTAMAGDQRSSSTKARNRLSRSSSASSASPSSSSSSAGTRTSTDTERKAG